MEFTVNFYFVISVHMFVTEMIENSSLCGEIFPTFVCFSKCFMELIKLHSSFRRFFGNLSSAQRVLLSFWLVSSSIKFRLRRKKSLNLQTFYNRFFSFLLSLSPFPKRRLTTQCLLLHAKCH